MLNLDFKLYFYWTCLTVPPQGGCCHLSEHHSEERHTAGRSRAAGVSEMSQTAAGGGAGDGKYTDSPLHSSSKLSKEICFVHTDIQGHPQDFLQSFIGKTLLRKV